MVRLILLALAVLLLPQEKKPGVAEIDAPLKDFRLRDVMKDAETFVTLSEFRDKKAVVLIFTSYTCDACEDYEGRIKKLVKDFEGKEVVFLGVRSSAEDDGPGMRKYAQAKGFTFPFLDDPKNLLADHLDVVVTPTFYVIDRKGVLRYRGAYDEALRAVLEGKEVALKTTRTIGCHMPRVEPGK